MLVVVALVGVDDDGVCLEQFYCPFSHGRGLVASFRLLQPCRALEHYGGVGLHEFEDGVIVLDLHQCGILSAFHEEFSDCLI